MEILFTSFKVLGQYGMADKIHTCLLSIGDHRGASELLADFRGALNAEVDPSSTVQNYLCGSRARPAMSWLPGMYSTMI